MYNSVYPINIKQYSGPNKSQIDKDQDNRQNSSNQNGRGNQSNEQKRHPYQPSPTSNTYGTDNFVRTTTPSENSEKKAGIKPFTPNINIAQILIDFRNTVSAIGTPEDITEEMNGYFKLIEKQAQSKDPNVHLIKSNLKNASLVLDKYISDSLSKPSKVVENWIDTLFLQKVDFSYDEEKINPDFQLKFAERKPQPSQKNIAEKPIENNAIENNTTESDASVEENVSEQETETPNKNKLYLPNDKILKKMFIQAKKYAMINDLPKSLDYFQKALQRSIALSDDTAQSMIYYEVAKLFDKKDLCTPALRNYQRTIIKTTNRTIKTKVNYNMAKIYQDYIKTKPAMEHFFVALSLAGETEDIATQSMSLSNIAALYAEKREKREVRKYANLANDLAQETKSPKIMGAVYAKNAKSYTVIDEPVEALSYYKESTKQYKKIDLHKKLARNFENSARLMRELGKFQKASNLYKKAYQQYSVLQDEKSMKYIFAQMSELTDLQ